MLPLEHSAILLTSNIKAIIGLENQFFCLFESGRFIQDLLYIKVEGFLELFENKVCLEKC